VLADSDGFNIIGSVSESERMGPAAAGSGGLRCLECVRRLSAWRGSGVRHRAGDGAARCSASLLASEKAIQTVLGLYTPDRRVENCRGRPRRPSPRHHSFAPCIIAAAARDVSCLLPLLAFCGSSSAPVTKNILADTQTLRYTVAPSIGERELKPAAGRLRRFSPKDESRVRELWLKLPAKPVW
jgi:hypothetical protein